METEPLFNVNTRVKIDRENGFYWVVGFGGDDSVTLWGGDADPGGYRSYRSIPPTKLKEDTRKLQGKCFPSFTRTQEENDEDGI